MTGAPPCVDCGGLPRPRNAHKARGLDPVCPHCIEVRARVSRGEHVPADELFPDLPCEPAFALYRAVCLRLGYTLRTTENQADVRLLHEVWGHALRVASVRDGTDHHPGNKIKYEGAAWELARQEAHEP